MHISLYACNSKLTTLVTISTDNLLADSLENVTESNCMHEGQTSDGQSGISMKVYAILGAFSFAPQ